MTRSKLGKSDPRLIPPQVRKYFKTNRRVLVVETDKTMKQMLATILEGNGFEVTIVHHDADVLEKLQHQRVDFMLLDIVPGERDSPGIYSNLRADPVARDVPVMALIASPHEKNLAQVVQLGIRHFLAKPFTEDELLWQILTL